MPASIPCTSPWARWVAVTGVAVTIAGVILAAVTGG
jgi:hypothetical protein